jgi:multiple sugar transport system substrate-binding protein
MDQRGRRPLSRRTLLKAGAVVGAGLAALASPLGTRGAALARYSRWLARQPLDTRQPITLRFMTRSGPGKRAFFKAAGDAFIKLHPNVTIHYEPHVNDWYTKLQVEIAGGAPPDLVFSSDDQMASLAVRGAFVDLMPFFQADGLKKSDFWPAALNPQMLGNHLFAMPLDYGVHVLFYNKALFDRQHLRYPTDKWTWDDFVKVGRHLTIDRNGKRASEAGFQPQHVRQYAEGGALSYWFLNVLRSNGGEWATPDLSKALLDTPVAIKTFQWIADLGNKYFTSPSPRYATSLSFAMEQGNVAMTFDGTWAFDVYPFYPVTKWQQGNIDIVPFPKGSKGHPVGAEASGLNVVKGAKPQNVKWAWEYIKWMTTEPGQRLGITYGVDSVPNSRTLAEELIPTYRQPRNHKIILQLLPEAKLPFWSEAISDADLENTLVSPPYSLAPEMLEMYKGQKTAAEAMPSVNRKVQAILDRDQKLARKFGATLHL